MTAMAQPVSPLSVGSLTQLTLSLLAIVALIFAISWALKRLRLAGPRGSGEIAVIDELSVGPRERIVLVRVGDAQVLVGIGAGGMVPLTPLAARIAVKEGERAQAFAQRLRDLMRRPPGASP
jgi:flagellar protein FliO/FliZ